MESYEKIGWLDHVIEAETGRIIQEGTPLSQKNLNHMDEGIFEAHEQLKSALQGDKPLLLTKGVNYGDELPAAGTPGRLFLLKMT